MMKTFGAVLLFALSTPLGCSSAEEEPDPLAKVAGFCDAWAKAACNESVVSACDAASPADCIETQTDFCLEVVPPAYTPAKAKQCLDAVGEAYKDADLTADELQIVRYLAAPCDELSAGSRQEGESCARNEECNTAAGFRCVVKLDATRGSCETPEPVAPGDPCDGDAHVCKEGYYCNGENCVAHKRTGVACEADYQCRPEDQCLITVDAEGAESGACSARLERNEVCSSDDECQSHYCLRETGATEGECASTIRLSRSEPLCDDLQ